MVQGRGGVGGGEVCGRLIIYVVDAFAVWICRHL